MQIMSQINFYLKGRVVYFLLLSVEKLNKKGFNLNFVTNEPVDKPFKVVQNIYVLPPLQ